MSRLIDADRLIVTMAEEMYTEKTFAEIMKEQPTVKAIPLDRVEQILSEIDIVKCGDWIATQTVRDMLEKALKEYMDGNK